MGPVNILFLVLVLVPLVAESKPVGKGRFHPADNANDNDYDVNDKANDKDYDKVNDNDKDYDIKPLKSKRGIQHAENTIANDYANDNNNDNANEMGNKPLENELKDAKLFSTRCKWVKQCWKSVCWWKKECTGYKNNHLREMGQVKL